MTTLLTRRAFFRRSAALGAGLVATTALPILPARAAIPPAIYTIQQQSSGRMLDAWGSSGHDYNVVTRPAHGDASQDWLVTYDDSGTATATLKQVSSHRFLDAHEIAEKDFHAVTRPEQTFDNTQKWQISSIGGGYYNIVQMSSNRLLDAHEIADRDFGVVTRPGGQTDKTQNWKLTFRRYA